MRVWKPFGSVVLVSICFAGLSFGGPRIASNPAFSRWQGQRDARADLAHGVYKQLSFGLAPEWGMNYQKIMEARYNVQVRTGGCIVTDEIVEYASAYNAVSHEGIVRHFGRDIFTETEKEAQVDWQRTRAEVVVLSVSPH